MEQGFHETLNVKELGESLDDLKETLDPWTGKNKKHKKKKRKEKVKEEGQKFTAEIENLGRRISVYYDFLIINVYIRINILNGLGAGTAALVPTEDEGQSMVWEASDTEFEDDVIYVELPKSKGTFYK